MRERNPKKTQTNWRVRNEWKIWISKLEKEGDAEWWVESLPFPFPVFFLLSHFIQMLFLWPCNHQPYYVMSQHFNFFFLLPYPLNIRSTKTLPLFSLPFCQNKFHHNLMVMKLRPFSYPFYQNDIFKGITHKLSLTVLLHYCFKIIIFIMK